MARAPRPIKPLKVPEWRRIYDQLLADADFDDVITYTALSTCLERDFKKNRGPIYRACRQLGALRHRWLEAEPRIGYRVIQANEHVRASLARKQRAQTQLVTMQVITRATELARLTDDERMLWDQQDRTNAVLIAMAFSHEDRISRMEEALRADGKAV